MIKSSTWRLLDCGGLVILVLLWVWLVIHSSISLWGNMSTILLNYLRDIVCLSLLSHLLCNYIVKVLLLLLPLLVKVKVIIVRWFRVAYVKCWVLLIEIFCWVWLLLLQYLNVFSVFLRLINSRLRFTKRLLVLVARVLLLLSQRPFIFKTAF